MADDEIFGAIAVSEEVWELISGMTLAPPDAAIATAPAIDCRNDAKDLRVRSPFEKEAERLRLAKHFMEKGTQ